MVIISKAFIKDFESKYPDTANALEKWYSETKSANWKNFAEMKLSFNTADSVGNDRLHLKNSVYEI